MGEIDNPFEVEPEEHIQVEPKPKKTTKTATASNSELVCSKCGAAISEKVYDYSKSRFGKPLCYDCQHAK